MLFFPENRLLIKFFIPAEKKTLKYNKVEYKL